MRPYELPVKQDKFSARNRKLKNTKPNPWFLLDSNADNRKTILLRQSMQSPPKELERLYLKWSGKILHINANKNHNQMLKISQLYKKTPDIDSHEKMRGASTVARMYP